MYLKRLELVGFKSFAQKTALDFPLGIAAVVGPNGSGKSNIIDAIRWLLGEREAKNMRSLKAEDLIFAGTPQRSRLSLAQATMVFDNSQHFFPVDYAEVSVRRRLESNGTSQHFLNDSEVRLKDIIDFFAQSRLGTKGFTIINQGDSDLFVRALPKERRAMLEEILGLRQFQLKKHDAELKLKSTKFNMEKARGLLDELLPRLRILRRQTAKWVKHADLEKELQALENKYFSFKRREIESDLGKLEPQIEKLDKAAAVLNNELKHREDELRKVQELEPKTGKNFDSWHKDKEALYARQSVLQKDLGRLEAQIDMALSQPEVKYEASELVQLLEEIRETLEDVLLETDIKTIKKLLKILFEKINHLLDAGSLEDVPRREIFKSSELTDSKEKIFNELKDIDKQVAALTSQEYKINEELKNFTAVFRKSFEAVEAKKDAINALTNSRNKLFFDRERIQMRSSELAHQASQIGRRLEEFSDDTQEELDVDSTEKRILRLRGELAGIGDIDQALLKESEEAESRYQFLSTQISDLEKAYKDLTSLIKELDTKIHHDFTGALKDINDEFNKYFKMMFGGGQGKLALEKINEKKEENLNKEDMPEVRDDEHAADYAGIEIGISIPRKRISSLDMLSGGEKSLVSLAVLFALISVSPPPFLVLDEVDAALDESNSRRFANLIRDFSKKTQFVVVTHNRATMEAADILYGITMGDDGTSRVLSLKLE